MKTRSLISSSLAIALASTSAFANSDNRWNPNWNIPTDNSGQIYYGLTKDQSQLTPFTSTKIEFTSTTPPPYYRLYCC